MKNPNLPAALLMTLAAGLMMSCDAKWETKKADDKVASVATAKAQENAILEGQQKIYDQQHTYHMLTILGVNINNLPQAQESLNQMGKDEKLTELKRAQELLGRYIRLGYEIIQVNENKKIPLSNKKGVVSAIKSAEALKTLCDSHVYRIQASNLSNDH